MRAPFPFPPDDIPVHGNAVTCFVTAVVEITRPSFVARVRHAFVLLCAAFVASHAVGATDAYYDVVVYGASSGGVTAAVQAARMGKSTLLISSNNHVGGVTAGGLSASDFGNAATIGGITAEFYRSVYRYYHAAPVDDTTSASTATSESDDAGITSIQFEFEPHIAESIFLVLLQDAGAVVQFGESLDRTSGVVRDGRRIQSIQMTNGRVYTARMFIDATYEGDLMAAAGVRYRIGREARSEYNEPLAGVLRVTHLQGEVDPYRIAGYRGSGLLPGIFENDPGADGTGDHRVQQYNLRLCLTDAPENRLPITQPANYDRTRYELLARRIRKEAGAPLTDYLKIARVPGGKTDINTSGSFSTDMLGDESWRWPEATDSERAAIYRRYVEYTQGLLWFLAHDPAVPEYIRADAAKWGLPADEFQDSDHWPWQLYVREARRMVGSYVMTQHDCERATVIADSIGLGCYGMDSHYVTLFVDANGVLNTEGGFFGGTEPYPISYRSIIPRMGECPNLLVPVCFSATHVAYGSMRMEPVYMIIGQSAGTAASLAIDEATTVQELDYRRLARRLNTDGQILRWPLAAGSVPSDVLDHRPTLPEQIGVPTAYIP